MKYGTGKRYIESSLAVLFIPLLATMGLSQNEMEDGRYKRAGNPPFERKVTSI